MYAPLLLFLIGLLVMACVSRGTSAQGVVKCPGKLDLLICLLGTLAAYGLLEAYRQAVNPLRASVGVDHCTYLTNVVASALGRWDLYNPDRMLPYAWLSAGMSALTGHYHHAAQAVSQVALAGVPAMTFLAGLPLLGRARAGLAALLPLAAPVLVTFSVMTSSYGLFFFTCAMALAAAAWAASLRTPITYLIAGVAFACCAAVQGQGGLLSLPLAVVLLGCTWGMSRREILARLGVLVLPLAVYAAVVPLFPVRYTPPSQLAAMYRTAIHAAMPYAWPTPEAPRTADFLPSFLRETELGALATSLLAPASADVVCFVEEQGSGRRVPLVIPNTSIPPLGTRVASNLEAASASFPEIAGVLVFLSLLGALGVLAPRCQQMDWSARRGGLLVLAAALTVGHALLMWYLPRYVLHAAPAFAILMVNGMCLLTDNLAGRRAANALIGFLVACIALSLWGRSRGVSLPREAYVGENNIRQGEAVLRVAKFLSESEGRFGYEVEIHDASPVSVWEYLTRDRRVRTPDANRYATAIALIRQPPADREILLIASNLQEFRSPDTPDPEALLKHWEPRFAVNTDTGQEIKITSSIPPNTIVVFHHLRSHEPK
ncbi:MAG: hypothetical protein FJX76_02180 [Armatimonadetes bacterium]|nr:hypothetical protein [Armatimonadota bacterium]